ncbi:hypothetical protein GGQ97_002609 [Sphingomonas kaistensis]|uniref:Lipoprotein n=1 Tax=Sphingomonas kaistensis TaxID=298708 RepID=A0A7X6BI56_9SPHN|nr:hypothetical protein [Sphingomonas kaistensis]NJC06816.1 hypothetical protein [Sphingomonas kaistensis]
MRKLFLIAAVFTASACASPKDRIAEGLTGYGVAEAPAQCVGAQLQRSLSLGQLQELGRVASATRARDPDPSRLTIDDFLRAASEVRDPRIAIEVAKAAGRCNLSPLGFAPAKYEMDDA